jgi:hypothetical protein
LSLTGIRQRRVCRVEAAGAVHAGARMGRRRAEVDALDRRTIE